MNIPIVITHKIFARILLPLAILLGVSPWVYAAESSGSKSLRKLDLASVNKRVVARGNVGYASHLRASTSPIPVKTDLPPEARARAFLSDYRELFLDSTTPLGLDLQRMSPTESSGVSHVRFQQSYKGVPVRGAEAIVHLNAVGVTSVQSKLLPNLAGVNLTYKVAPNHALSIAAKTMGIAYPGAVLNFTAPRLEIVNVDMLFGRTLGESRLAWFSEVRGTGVREFLWVDALNGEVLTHFSQIASAAIESITVADYRTQCYLDADAAWDQYDFILGMPPSGSEAESAFNNSTAAYDYFLNTFTRDTSGYGTGTSSLTAIMNLCAADFAPISPLVTEKARWDGQYMRFATGVSVADDIVGHEYTHALLDNEANSLPVPYMVGQTGALAEGFADIFGEVIDLVQNTTNDAGDVRWAIGEDAPGGSFRNLMTPGAFQLPEKSSDPNAYCGTDNDVSIHTNGAVLAHAFALLADGTEGKVGGTFNGITVAGIGIEKAAKIFYKAMEYMTAVASFNDAYHGLITAAGVLVKDGVITAPDLAQLRKAINAVELNAAPCGTHLDYCPMGQAAQPVFSDNFETISAGKWINTAATGVNHWNTGVGSPGIHQAAIKNTIVAPFNGTYSLWADGNRGELGAKQGDSMVEMASAITVPSGDARLQFEGKFTFEQTTSEPFADILLGPDGGRIEYSVDGVSWLDAGALISTGQAYNGTINVSVSNPLSGSLAFVGSNGGYKSTQLNLQSLVGQSVRFRFRVGTDKDGTNGAGWLIDDVAIYACSPAALVVTPQSGLKTSESGGAATFNVSLADAPSKQVILAITTNNAAEGVASPAQLVFDATNFDQVQTVTVTGVDDSARDGTTSYKVKVSVEPSSDSGYQNLPAEEVSLVNTDNEKKKKGGGDMGLSALFLLVLIRVIQSAYFYRRRHPLLS